MLSALQKNKYTARAKKVAKTLLQNLNITKLDEDNIGEFQLALDVNVAGLVSLQEAQNKEIDSELLEIYDLLVDIVLENEEDLDSLNQLFFH